MLTASRATVAERRELQRDEGMSSAPLQLWIRVRARPVSRDLADALQRLRRRDTFCRFRGRTVDSCERRRQGK